MTIHVGLKWYFDMVLICISLMSSDVDYVVTYHLYIFFGETSIQVFTYLLIRLLCWIIEVLFAEINPLSDL
jgi:hypothetical protein